LRRTGHAGQGGFACEGKQPDQITSGLCIKQVAQPFGHAITLWQIRARPSEGSRQGRGDLATAGGAAILRSGEVSAFGKKQKGPGISEAFQAIDGGR